MIPQQKKKGLASVIVAKMSAMPDKKSMRKEGYGMREDAREMEDEEEDSSPDIDPALETAAEEVMEALESKDVRGFIQSMKDFVYLCQEQ